MIQYGMTKTAQAAVARGLAEALAGTGVTVNSVLVGPSASEGVGAFVQDLASVGPITLETVPPAASSSSTRSCTLRAVCR